MRGKKVKGLQGKGDRSTKGRGLSLRSRTLEVNFDSGDSTPIIGDPNNQATLDTTVAHVTAHTNQAIPTPVTVPTARANRKKVVPPTTAPTNVTRTTSASPPVSGPTTQATRATAFPPTVIPPLAANTHDVVSSPPSASHEQAAATTSSPPINTSVEVDASNGAPRAGSDDTATFDGSTITPRFITITCATTDGDQGEFYPIEISHKVSEEITASFKEKLVKEGWTWKEVPNAIKGLYWKEFKVCQIISFLLLTF